MTRTTRDDPGLVEACAAGDEQALGRLYDRYGKLAYGVAVGVLRDRDLAEDAVQDAFLTVWRQAGGYDRGRGKVATWILTLVHRRAVDRVRRQQRFNELPAELAAAAPRTAVDEVADGVALRSDVRAALRTLSSAEREVLDLAYWGGLTQSQIATALEIPLGTVKTRTFSALAKLRDALRQDFDGGSPIRSRRTGEAAPRAEECIESTG
jgi:RNA polymerase sigma-70 factor (ECF subfamily)